ncbi:MAG: hypothetical protein IJU51_07430 [Clostridia bacterium]|nr:hypothetical protein [Clostridia bacterium]
MKITEKAAYVKGLVEGLELDPKDKQTKVFKALVDLVNEMAQEISELEQCYDDVCDQIDALDEDLAGVEDALYEDDDDEDDFDGVCSCGCDDAAYEVTCPTCGTVIGLNEDDLGQGGMTCPKCGETLEFDYDEDELDDTDDAEEESEKLD